MLDLAERLAPETRVSGLLGLTAAMVGIPWFGWIRVLPTTSHAIIFRRPLSRARMLKRPELVIVGSAVAGILAVGLAIVLGTPQPLFSLPFLSVMTIVQSGTRWAMFFWLFAAAVMAATAFLCAPAATILHDPGVLVFPECLLASTCLIGRAIGRVTIANRSQALVDPLTGALNRAALEARLPELTHRSAVDCATIGLILGDLDHFKSVNDTYGHTIGDQVLRAAAERIRSSLRAFDSVYRVGGEEFAILLSSPDASSSAQVAERIRSRLESEPVAGLPVTGSFGVAIFAGGEGFDYNVLYEHADQRLYAAKRAGRNRVVAGQDTADLPAAA